MSDAIASPAPLGPVTEESTPAPSVGAGPGPSVGRSYDDVSYTHYPSHGSGFSTDPAYAYNYQPSRLAAVSVSRVSTKDFFFKR
eukprot:scaffold2772_cov121-Isochrysis_galbana.AAC.1